MIRESVVTLSQEHRDICCGHSFQGRVRRSLQILAEQLPVLFKVPFDIHAYVLLKPETSASVDFVICAVGDFSAQ